MRLRKAMKLLALVCAFLVANSSFASSECRRSLTLNRPVSPEKHVSDWSAQDWANFRAQKLELFTLEESPSPKTTNRVLFLQDLPPDMQRLAKQLVRKASDPKNLNRARQIKFDFIGQSLPAPELLSAMSPQERREFQDRYSQLDYPYIEYGAWRMVMDSGEVFTALHTSHKEELVEAEDLGKAIEGLLTSLFPDFDLTDIAELHYLHNHPVVYPLSEGDILANRQTALYLREYNPDARVHIYAVVDTMDGIKIFHQEAREE